jgi:two-component system sensor histidine kinase RstB
VGVIVNIYIKSFCVFVVCFIIVLVIIFSAHKALVNKINDESGRILTRGVLTTIENELVKLPSAQWTGALNSFQSSHESIFKIIPIKDLHLNPKQVEILNKGETLFYSGKTLQFLNYVLVEHFALIQIGKTPYAITYKFGTTHENLIETSTEEIRSLITQELMATPKALWPQSLHNLEKRYGFPIRVFSIQDKPIAEKLAYSTNVMGSKITTLYFTFDNDTQVLAMGPLDYSPIKNRVSDMIYYFILIVFLFTLGVIIILATLFIRNVNRLYQLTSHYSQGDFAYHCKINSLSILKGLYNNVIAMGKQLKQLIDLHKKMTRFVAHEIRTPLSTLQMAVDVLRKESVLNDNMKKQLNSIQEDVDELNSLVISFLLYSQMQSNELTINKTQHDLILWLREVIDRYKVSPFKISLNTNKTNHLNILFDDQLFKHVINNILTNAIKFAKEQMVVTVERIHNGIIIHIDDDGPGLPEDTGNDIFAEFTTSKAQSSLEKHMGLGLAIAKTLVELHEGTIYATKSPILAGARFSVFLPNN